jgi:hypothetical protein
MEKRLPACVPSDLRFSVHTHLGVGAAEPTDLYHAGTADTALRSRNPDQADSSGERLADGLQHI